MTCRVVNVRVEKPDVRIGRPSRWGNPFRLDNENERAAVIERYRHYLNEEILAGRITLAELRALDGQTLGCYCAPKACHGDVLASAVAWALTQPGPKPAGPDQPHPQGALAIAETPLDPRCAEESARLAYESGAFPAAAPTFAPTALSGAKHARPVRAVRSADGVGHTHNHQTGLPQLVGT